MNIKKIALVLISGIAMASAHAQKSAAVQAIEEYRAMLADGNPADLFEAKGEDLWKKNPRPEECVTGKMRPGPRTGRC